MLPSYALSPFKRITVLFTIAGLVVATLGSSFSPLLSPAKGQDAQNTDIFTGQFIPAYLGAAYDPSEAYKQMAGMPVYVYAYDTYDKIINNYIYKSQIRADGSFQAAGLPNASHYGVCVPVNDNGRYVNNGAPGGWSPFRPPITGAGGDGLEGVFAFNEGLYPRTPVNPRNQVGNEVELSNVNANYQPTPPATAPDAAHQGCRTFFTSNKTVDIANHINIFPLVPTTVLSVLIVDPVVTNGITDTYNQNSPYEVYAQRVSVTTTTDPCGQQSGGLSGNNCLPPTVTNTTVSNGPIIRGRTVPEQDSGTTTVATIFQAYAPPGIYAITYWRPDSRDVKTALTYLSYNGSQPINTPYNGIAFENVVKGGDFVPIKVDANGGSPTVDNNQWKLATRDPSPDAHFAWFPKPGNLNIWGLTTTASLGAPVPVGGSTANIGNTWFGFLNPMTRTCQTSGNITSGTIPSWGIYLFSTSCTKNSGFLPSTTTELSFSGYTASPDNSGLGAALTGAAQSAGSAAAGLVFSGIDNQSVSASGALGPSRRDFSLTTEPTTGVTAYIKKDGMPIAPTSFSMQVDGKVFRDIAYSRSGGKLIIPGVYFDGKSPKQYKVFATRNTGGVLGTQTIDNQLAFTIDGGSLKDPTLAMNDLGSVDVGSHIGTVGRWLAGLNLNNLINHLHTPQVFAAGSSTVTLNESDVRLWLDMGAIHSIAGSNTWFTYNNYDLDQVEIVYPSGAFDDSQNYVVFNRYTHIQNNQPALDGSKDGIITSSDGTNANNNSQTQQQVAEGQNPEIVGVELTLKELEPGNENIAHKLDDAFRDYQTSTAANTSFAGTMPLTLRVKFTKVNSHDASSSNSGDASQTGQDQSQAYPAELTAEWPLELQDTTPNRDYQTDKGKYTYNLSYSPITLAVTPPGCSGGGGHIPGTGIGLPSTDPSYYVCKAVTGIVSMVGGAVQFVANNLITVNPLAYSVTRDGWNVMRNFVNGLAVLILVLYGIAIMLRYEPQTYNVRQLMTRLISTVLLVNFSILIIQFGIDLANVFSAGGYYFLLKALEASGAVTGNGMMAAAAGMVAISAAVFTVAVTLPGPALLAALLVIFAVLVALLIIIGKAIFYWILRTLILVICIVVAPIALVARIVPTTQTYYAKWKNLLTSTLINQVLFAFVLALAMGILQSATRASGGLVAALAEMAIAIGLFYYSTKFPQKAAAALEGASGIAIGSLAKAGLQKFSSSYNEMRTRSAMRRTQRRERELALGIDKKAQQEAISQHDRDLAAAGWGRMPRFMIRQWQKGANGLQNTGKMQVANYNRGARRLQQTGAIGLMTGLKPEDLSKASEEGREKANKEYEAMLNWQAREERETAEEQQSAMKRGDMRAKAVDAVIRAGSPEAAAFIQRQAEQDKIAASKKEMDVADIKRAKESSFDLKREADLEDARTNAMTEADSVEIDMSDLGSLAIKRRSESLDKVADARGELEKRQQIFTPATDAARANKRQLNTETKKAEGADIVRRIQGDLAHPSIFKGEQEEHEKAEKMKIANAGADAINRHTFDDSKDWMATGGLSTVTLSKVDEEGNELVKLGMRRGVGNTNIYRQAFISKTKDVLKRTTATKRGTALRAMRSVQRQLEDPAHHDALKDNKSVQGFFQNEVSYTVPDTSAGAAPGATVTYTGVAATRAMLKDMDIPEEQVSNDAAAVAFASKMFTTDVLEAARMPEAVLSDEDKAKAKELMNEDNRAMKQLSDKGSSDKSFVTATIPELDASNATRYPALASRFAPVGAAGPVMPNPFGNGQEYIVGNTTRPIKENDMAGIMKALETVNAAMQAADANQLSNGSPGSITGGNILTAATTPQVGQYASALDALKKAGYPTGH